MPDGSAQLLTPARDRRGDCPPCLFRRGARRKAPTLWRYRRSNSDPHWRDLILFYEYFHGDNGAGIGASHQTGWTGDISLLSMLTGSAAAMAQAFDGDRNQYLPGSHLHTVRSRGAMGTTAN